MAAIEFWKSNYANIFATKGDRNMNKHIVLYVFRHKQVDSAVTFDETHPQITIAVIYRPKSNRRSTLSRNS